MGADQPILTICGAIIVILYIVISGFKPSSKNTYQNLILTVSNSSDKALNEGQIIEILQKYCNKVEVRRLDQTSKTTELSLYVEFKNIDGVLQAKKDLQSNADVQFSFIKVY